MRAAVIERFGSADELKMSDVPVPDIAGTEILLRVRFAGVGEWDPFEREGGYAALTGSPPTFPYVLGSEGAGVVASVGNQVTGVATGDRVYATAFLNPKGGLYAEYAAVRADMVARVPPRISLEQAAVASGVGITALRGLDDVLRLRDGETVLIIGAGGGVGHIAVQMARARGARVVAVASGDDGVALAARLGADACVDGHGPDALRTLGKEVGDGVVDAALTTAGGRAADRFLALVRPGGRIAWPKRRRPTCTWPARSHWTRPPRRTARSTSTISASSCSASTEGAETHAPSSFAFSLPASFSALRSRNSICAFTLRSSSAAHRSIAS